MRIVETIVIPILKVWQDDFKRCLRFIWKGKNIIMIYMTVYVRGVNTLAREATLSKLSF